MIFLTPGEHLTLSWQASVTPEAATMFVIEGLTGRVRSGRAPTTVLTVSLRFGRRQTICTSRTADKTVRIMEGGGADGTGSTASNMRPRYCAVAGDTPFYFNTSGAVR